MMSNILKINTLAGQFDSMLSKNFDDIFSPELFSGLLVCLLIIIFSVCVFISIKRSDIKKAPKGLALVACILVEKAENFVVEIMGERNRTFAGYAIALASFIMMSFIIGLTGFANPLTNLTIPFVLGLCTFFLIHLTAMKENKWRYFHRYIEPIPVFLPINLISMWAPLLSITLRIFGNALSGMCLMTVVYFGTKTLSGAIFGPLFPGEYWVNATEGFIAGSVSMGPAGIFVAPFITPILHAYFDLFSGVIQTLVFVILTMIWVYQEQNEEDPNLVIEKVSLKK